MNTGFSAYEVIDRRAPRLQEHEPLLCDLQRVHDEFDVVAWPHRFRAVARINDLSEEVIDRWEAEQKAGAE